MSHSDSAIQQYSSKRLARSLSVPETWAFGLTSHMGWVAVVPAIHAALGAQAISVWIPAMIVGMLLNYQVKHLGTGFVDVAGGTPNYITKLWKRYPGVARYAAIGYLLNWITYISINSVILTDLIKVNLEALGISCPELILKFGFTILPFVVAFSGTRALSILHLFFVIPAFVVLLAFCLQGLSFLAFSPESPGLFPRSWASLSFVDWAKWFYFVTYQTYGCETASSFVADSRRPKETLQFLKIAAWLMPPMILGGSWVVTRLATTEDVDNAFVIFVSASQPFWGHFAQLFVTFLLASSCLLGSATVVSNCPRILYQLAVDKQLSPVFSVVSRRGIFGFALTLILILCLINLIWGNVAHIIVAGNFCWFMSFMILHLGLWLQRGKKEVLFPQLALSFFLLEVVVLLVGGYAWGWQDFLIGLVAPFAMIGIDALARRIPFAPLSPLWWVQLYQSRSPTKIKDSVMLQVNILILLLCGAVSVGWWFGVKLNAKEGEALVVVLLLVVGYVGVAIASLTSLPQVMAIAEAREAAEHLFMVAQDAIVVVNEAGVIRQANPAIQSLLSLNLSSILGHHLSEWLPGLANTPQKWTKRSEQTLHYNNQAKTFEVSVSDIPHQDFPEYVVILHDITKRKQAEEVLRQSEAQLRSKSQQLAAQLVQSEKMSSLGQLVAGVAHEINNPVSFIYGNLSYADEHTQDLLTIVQLYQQHYPHPVPEIQAQAKAIDLDFLIEDLPKLLTSMKIGAERITQIVLSLRNFSRLDEAEMKVVDIHSGIDSTLMILQHRLKAKSDLPEIQVIKEYGDLPLVECYPGQLNQVFMNILANAIDAIEESLVICHLSSVNNSQQRTKDTGLRTNPQICISTTTQDNNVIISIADNGAGIPEAVQKRLFDPFFTTKPVGKGTGLGLSISYQIITEKHGGTLQCISSLGEGTQFVITIPHRREKSSRLGV
ncbi:ATP-binding protein [Iningainema tapete]|uniref:histidine kinase n=1 Tax=Iningainema tapete BLCC-T55 TaxID=2748662 RepID=A0A8J6XMG1_9CYAN|nr:ATP-binding protein [Iningainema tapete]MBD2775586.1 amino acid permease [Iningainema tapete BLCC-T55]